ncbi:MAG: hypothetical protein ACJAUV_001642 [Flavobacteriales bacterium]|jgi:hypothetical protein
MWYEFCKIEVLKQRNMKKLIYAITFCLFASSSYAQYSETRIIKDFDELRVIGPFEIELVEDQAKQLVIESAEIDLHKIITEMDGTALKIRSAAAFTSKKTIHIKINYDVIRELTASAGAIIFSNKPIYGDKIAIKANAGGRIELQLDMEKLEIKATQGAQVMLEGKVKTAEMHCTTGANLDASNLKTNTVFVESSTGGLVEVFATDKLDAHATTKGRILYVGNPSKLINEVKLKGSIKKKG